MRKHLLALVLGLILTNYETAKSQVVINELSNANETTWFDQDSTADDWIEIYNAGNEEVNLKDHYLSDSEKDPEKWQFPSYPLKAKEYLVVFASGKNIRFPRIDHWETAIHYDEEWKYFPGLSEPDANWKLLDFDDSSWDAGKGGFGFGDGDDNTSIPDEAFSVYLRKAFNINDTAQIAAGVFHIDFDDGFVAYLNGKEIARENISPHLTNPPFDTRASDSHEAVMYEGLDPHGYTIDEKILSEVLRNGKNVLCIQVHNRDTSSSDISSNAFLSFGITENGKYYQEVPGWFDSEAYNYTLHTNFGISKDGETVFLSHNGNTIDEIYSGKLNADHSLGKCNDAGEGLGVFEDPTPGASNNGSACYDGYEPAPVFTVEPGFYHKSKTITFFQPSATGDIRYTTNGNFPKKGDKAYNASIKVDKTTVVTARNYSKTNKLPSEVVKQTYFIDEKDVEGLPVISISMDSLDLWDWETGIYVMGPNADPEEPYEGANFYYDWERKAHIEYFDSTSKRQFGLVAGLKLDGSRSRKQPQKSFKIIARDEYGQDRVRYPLFKARPYKVFKSFILHNGGGDYRKGRFRDALGGQLMKDSEIDYAAYEPVMVFLNGAYWGTYGLRENLNEHYLESRHGVDNDKVDMIKHRGHEITAPNGDVGGFFAMHKDITSSNPKASGFYEKASRLIDLENFTDYFAAQIYLGNDDWINHTAPCNNIKAWSDQKTGEKWRYIMYDLDRVLGKKRMNPELSNLAMVHNPDGDQEHSQIFRTLLKNTKYRNYFVNRYADLMNTVFLQHKLREQVYKMRDELDPYMHRHFEKWDKTYEYWQEHIARMLEYNGARQTYARQHIVTEFSLEGQVEVTLKVVPKDAGKIKISTIVPDSLPWKGIYFKGVPVQMKAIPNPGFKFENWGANGMIGKTYEQQIKVDVKANADFVANFSGDAEEPKIAISEINYNSHDKLDAGDWIELHNYSDHELYLNGWHLKDGNGNVLSFSDDAVIGPHSYMVLANDTALFSASHPEVKNYVGGLSFGFKSGGETIQLYDDNDSLRIDLTYDNKRPWPEAADGNGYTLELLAPEAEPSKSSSWFAGCLGGSPGTAYSNCENDIVITEINYHPHEKFNTGNWIELFNRGSGEIDLSGWEIATDTSVFTIPKNTKIAAGGYLVLTSDAAGFASKFPAVNNYGQMPQNLVANRYISLLDANTKLRYNVQPSDQDPWPVEAAGKGATLELKDPQASPADPENWFAGCFGGSPGEKFQSCNQPVVISEINYFSHPDKDAGDWLELWNTTAVPVDMSGWEVRNSQDNNTYHLPEDLEIKPNERLVLGNSKELFSSQHPGINNFSGTVPFDLDNSGDIIRLYNKIGKLKAAAAFESQLPWPKEAKGEGRTLELDNPEGKSYTADNWLAGCYGGSPGKPYSPNCMDTGMGNPGNGLMVQVFTGPGGEIIVRVFNANPADLMIELYDIVGKKIKAMDKIRQQEAINVGSFAAGTYLLKVVSKKDPGVLVTNKVVVE